MLDLDRKITLGILADADAGKTTLSEAMLFLSGAIRRLGRVDDRSAFLDTYELERARGITIYSKQAVFEYDSVRFFLIDTPGHADFAAETERAADILDYAVMLINGCDGVTAHAMQLWKILRKKNVPAFIFVNKTDLAGFDKERIMSDLAKRFGDGVIDMSQSRESLSEKAALCDEQLLDQLVANDCLTDHQLARAVKRNSIFPCFFGSALKTQGVEELLNALTALTLPVKYGSDFSAKVYKIERGSDGKRSAVMKITGGTLGVRDSIKYRAADGSVVEQKAVFIRSYSGSKAVDIDSASAGDVVSVWGLTEVYAGMTIGAHSENAPPANNAAVSFTVFPPKDCSEHTLYERLTELCEEDPSLCVRFDRRTGQNEISLSGELQKEVLLHELKRRFDLDVTFGSGRILYKETIAAPVEGVGHFEPLRHYAEVHLVLSPLPTGSGLIYDSAVSEDKLDKNWQNLIISSLKAKEHCGVLTGSPITDMRITLTGGRTHLKHTEGGDLREAAWRALRQGLMKAESILLEPFCRFTLTVPAAQVGRALSDLDNMNAQFSQPESDGDMQSVSGRAAAAKLKEYAAEVTAYTHAKGTLYTEADGYSPCLEADNIIAECGYDPCADLDNTPDSVFCSHGSGVIVSWDEVEKHMHLPLTLTEDKQMPLPIEKSRKYSISDDELKSIMEKLAPEPKKNNEANESRRLLDNARHAAAKSAKPDNRPKLLIVDGYNIIFAWERLRELAAANIDSACSELADILSNYAGFSGKEIMLVFDAYKTPAVTPHKVRAEAIEVIYTRSGQTSDAFIESFCSENRKKLRITVASSDGAVQMSVMRCGALRISARELETEIDSAQRRISEIISRS